MKSCYKHDIICTGNRGQPMPKLRRFAYSSVAAAAVCLWLPNAAAARDITEQIRRETDVDQRVAQACRSYCLGNASRGKLKYFRVEDGGNGRYAVQAMAHMRNRHSPMTGVVLYDHTVAVIADGDLRKATCELVITGVRVTNDFQGIFTNLLRQNGDIVGSKHVVQNCERYLR